MGRGALDWSALDLRFGAAPFPLAEYSKQEDRITSTFLGLLCFLHRDLRQDILSRLLDQSDIPPGKIRTVLEISPQWPNEVGRWYEQRHSLNKSLEEKTSRPDGRIVFLASPGKVIIPWTIGIEAKIGDVFEDRQVSSHQKLIEQHAEELKEILAPQMRKYFLLSKKQTFNPMKRALLTISKNSADRSKRVSAKERIICKSWWDVIQVIEQSSSNHSDLTEEERVFISGFCRRVMEMIYADEEPDIHQRPLPDDFIRWANTRAPEIQDTRRWSRHGFDFHIQWRGEECLSWIFIGSFRSDSMLGRELDKHEVGKEFEHLVLLSIDLKPSILERDTFRMNEVLKGSEGRLKSLVEKLGFELLEYTDSDIKKLHARWRKIRVVTTMEKFIAALKNQRADVDNLVDMMKEELDKARGV